MDTCFMCDLPATTDDHIPPLCIFPEQKDLGIDYRKNLITVPACENHNLSTSLDDEYLMAIIAFHWRNNKVAYGQVTSKIMRAFRHNKRYFDLFFGDGKNKFIFWNDEALVTTSVDIDRFKRVFEKIARGIYFHHLGIKWNGDVLVQPLSFVITHDEAQTHALMSLMQNTQEINILCSSEPPVGENPDVFFYQIAYNDPLKSTALRMVFYNGFVVIAVLMDNPYKNS